MRRSALLLATILFAIVLAACGGAGDDSADAGQGGATEAGDDSSGDEDPEDALGSALGAGGGGTLVFDGEEIPIESAICSIFDDQIDVGTVSESGHRVLLGTNRADNPISVQILDPDSVQWFPQGVSGDEADREGNTFTSGLTPYFNNSNDRIIEASFTVECP